jgi:asparagine synthase (glutamine-hydrolysing)
VLLSGEGADETFGGYVNQYRVNALQRVVRSKGVIGEMFLRRGLGLAARAGMRIGMRAAPGRQPSMHDALTGGLRNWRLFQDALTTYERYGDPLDRELAAELLTQLQSYILPILHRTDRASMAASIEARVPFLDPDLVGLALAVPPKLKVGVSGFRPVGKRILKSVAERWLPHDIIYRPKMGFTVPPAYYTGPWPREWTEEGFVREAFGAEPHDLRGWLSQEPTQTAGWMLTLEIWGQIFVRGRSPAEVADEFLGTS